MSAALAFKQRPLATIVLCLGFAAGIFACLGLGAQAQADGASARNESGKAEEVYRYRIVGPAGYSIADLTTVQERLIDRRFKSVPGVDGVRIVTVGHEPRRGFLVPRGDDSYLQGAVLMQSSEDGQSTAKAVEAVVERINASNVVLPPGIHIVPVGEGTSSITTIFSAAAGSASQMAPLFCVIAVLLLVPPIGLVVFGLRLDWRRRLDASRSG